MDTKRLCRKCNDKIPNRVNIEGKTYNLRNRKFCLGCSPHKAHNTHPFDPGNKGRRKRNSDQNRKYVLTLYKRGLERKCLLISNAGGKCQICGYDKCRDALTFHHREPSTKLFGLSIDNLWSRSLTAILQEAEKCDLLCSNCHREKEVDRTGIVRAVNERYGTNF